MSTSSCTFQTATGSLYELDAGQRRVRRVTESRAATSYQGADGAWRPYLAAQLVAYPGDTGESVAFHWGRGQFTITSEVVVEHLGAVRQALQHRRFERAGVIETFAPAEPDTGHRTS